LRGISDKFVFLDGFDPEEMVSSFVFAETFPFPLCPNDEEGMKIAKHVMLKRWSGGKTIVMGPRGEGVNRLLFFLDLGAMLGSSL
jgi:hypothetical protein